MYGIKATHRFKKDVKRCQARGLDLSLLETAVDILQHTGTLPPEYKPHRLQGSYGGYWECHIKPDWLLIWQQDDTQLVLLLTNTGTHSDLFG
jgi:mRNA interferase YafQ